MIHRSCCKSHHHCTCAELVKIRLQIERNSSQPLYTGPRSCIRYIIAKRGFGGLYRGLVLTTLRDTVSWVYFFLSFSRGFDYKKPYIHCYSLRLEFTFGSIIDSFKCSKIFTLDDS